MPVSIMSSMPYEYTKAASYLFTMTKALLKQAGYDGKRIKTSVLISTSGSGQMLPLPMNEYVQENLRAVGIDLELLPTTIECHIELPFAGIDSGTDCDTLGHLRRPSLVRRT